MLCASAIRNCRTSCGPCNGPCKENVSSTEHRSMTDPTATAPVIPGGVGRRAAQRLHVDNSSEFSEVHCWQVQVSLQRTEERGEESLSTSLTPTPSVPRSRDPPPEAPSAPVASENGVSSCIPLRGQPYRVMRSRCAKWCIMHLPQLYIHTFHTPKNFGTQKYHQRERNEV